MFTTNFITKFRTGALLTAAALFLSAIPALAGDAIKASVTLPPSGPAPVVKLNGSGYTPGTYAIGTVQLFYTVTANAFTPGDFASFDVVLENTTNYNGGKATSYPVTLQLHQVGSSGLVLTPTPASFTVNSGSWQSVSHVVISIPAGAPSADGTDLVGNLQLDTDPSGSHLDTVTKVQVHVKLVHPAGPCIRVYDFVTNEDDLAPLTAPFTVNVNRGSIKSSNPGQLSDNIVVVNTCPLSESFDLKMTLDSAFTVHPNGNAGNAVFSFVSWGTPTPTAATVVSLAIDPGQKQGQALCLPSLTLQPNQTLLTTVHIAIDKSVPASALPSGGFQFAADLRTAGQGCTGSLSVLASPNPVSVNLPYSVQ